MEFVFRQKRFWLLRIVLFPRPNSACPPLSQFRRRFSERGESTWSVAAPCRSRIAFRWSVSCRTGSHPKGFLRKAPHGRCNSWIGAHSSRSHARAVGIREASLGCRSAAAICGTGTLPGFLVGVKDGGSPTL